MAYFSLFFDDRGMRLGGKDDNARQLIAIGAAIRACRQLQGISREALAYTTEIIEATWVRLKEESET